MRHCLKAKYQERGAPPDHIPEIGKPYGANIGQRYPEEVKNQNEDTPFTLNTSTGPPFRLSQGGASLKSEIPERGPLQGQIPGRGNLLQAQYQGGFTL